MGVKELPGQILGAVPAKAAAEWLALLAVLERVGTVACQTAGADAWWPGRGQPGQVSRAAAAACRRCPACGQCLDYALAADEPFGIWGGSLPQERRAMRWAAEASQADA